MMMASSWSMVAGALALLNLAAAASTPIILDSYSAQLDYQPDSTTGPAGSWNSSFTGSPWSARVSGQRGGQVGHGLGYHYTQVASNVTDSPVWVGYTFYGTGVEFFGYFGYLGDGTKTGGEGGSMKMSLSGGPDQLSDIENSGSISSVTAPRSLGKFENLKLGNYTVRFTPTAGTVSFTHLVVQMEVGGSAKDVSAALANPSVFKPYTENADNSITRSDKFGEWKGPNGVGTGSWAGQQSDNNKRVGTNAFGDSVKVDLGVGNIFMRLNGTSNSNHGVVKLEFDPAPPGADATKTYWAFTSWQVLDTTLIAIGLDPQKQYQVTITNMQNDGVSSDKWPWFDLTSLTLWRSETSATATGNRALGAAETGGQSGSKNKGGSAVPIGAIIGAVIGGVALIAAIIGGVLLWKRHSRDKRDVHPTAGLIDPESYITTPFVVDHEGGGAGAAGQGMTMSQLHPYSQMSTGPNSYSESGSANGRQMSWSEASSGQPMSANFNPMHAPYSDGSGSWGGLAGLAAGAVPAGVMGHQGQRQGGAKLAPQPQPALYLATDAGPPPQPMDDATPMGEMPPTYDPSWVGSSASGPSVAAPDMPQHQPQPPASDHLPPGAGQAPAPAAAMGRVIGGSDSKGPR